jgi:hypothetical protein
VGQEEVVGAHGNAKALDGFIISLEESIDWMA